MEENTCFCCAIKPFRNFSFHFSNTPCPSLNQFLKKINRNFFSSLDVLYAYIKKLWLFLLTPTYALQLNYRKDTSKGSKYIDLSKLSPMQKKDYFYHCRILTEKILEKVRSLSIILPSYFQGMTKYSQAGRGGTRTIKFLSDMMRTTHSGTKQHFFSKSV